MTVASVFQTQPSSRRGLLAVFSCICLVLAHAGTESAISPTSYLTRVQGPLEHVSQTWSKHHHSPKHAEIVATAPDTWVTLPKALDPNFKNPCWKDRATQRLRCMPYYQIIGVSKCGTTDMFNRLRKHPDMAAGSKGPHFWDECPSPPKSTCTAPPNGDFDGYVDLFKKGAEQISQNPQAVCGEASSNTYTGVFTYVRGMAKAKGTNITLAELLFEAQPHTRLVVIMREPVSRFYSAFHYYRRSSKEPFEGPELFHKRAESEIGRWRECEAQHSRHECLKRYDPQQLIKGMYSEFVEAWTSKFPTNQIMWVRTEDYKAAPQEHLMAVLTFLGLRNLTETEWGDMVRMKQSNSQSARYPSMNPATRTMLEEFYRPFNERLAKLLGDDRYKWLDRRKTSKPL